MQRPSSRNRDYQQQHHQQQIQQQQHQQEAIEAASLTAAGGALPLQHQRSDANEDRGDYHISRPVSPLITPNIQARPSSVIVRAGDFDNLNKSSNESNKDILLQSENKNSEDNDSPPQSPISFLDSPRPLIQAQDLASPITDSAENTSSSPTNTTAPNSALYWPSSASSTSQSTTTGTASASRREPLTISPALKASSLTFDQQRGVLKAPTPLGTSTSTTNRNESTASRAATSGKQSSAAYHNQSQPSRSNNSPISPASQEKKKRNWFGWSRGSSKDNSVSNPSQQQQQQQQQRHQPQQKPLRPSGPSPSNSYQQQPLNTSGKGVNPSIRSGPSQQPLSTAGPKVLQKKNRQALDKSKPKQVVYQNPRANNNSPEPSIISKITNEEQDLNEDHSDSIKNDTETTTTLVSSTRRPQSVQSESSPTSPVRPSLENFEPDSETSFKTASSQSNQPGISGGHTSAPVWESRLRSGSGHHRVPSTDETIAIQSGASAQTNRAELKYRDERYTSGSRPPSRQSLETESPSESTFNLAHTRTNSTQNTNQQKGYMGGSANQQHPSGRNGEVQNTQSIREGQYGSTLSVNNPQQPASYRNTPQASPMVQDSGAGQGRNTPPPGTNASKSREDLGNMDMQQLSSKHEELNEKYRKVKKYYFDKDAQVQALQNQLAHQRLSQSRTQLDDNEYATRFARLDGAINNLAFNIRKDWRAVPSWLAHCVNRDATTIVTKEMTAVGRACISRWLVDEVFDRYFHPGLEPHLSCQLKVIEKNIRRFLPPPTTDDERESLVAKMSNWRLSTLDGLKTVLESEDGREESTNYRDELTKMLVTMLTEDLRDNLKEPPPPGLDAGVIGIIELVVGIAANIPYESRDIFVDYLMPGVPVNDAIMKIEAALPALTNPGENTTGDPHPSNLAHHEHSDDESDVDYKDGRKKGVLGGIINRGKNKDVGKEERVRFAAFMVVEVRGGKSVLVKAPVYV